MSTRACFNCNTAWPFAKLEEGHPLCVSCADPALYRDIWRTLQDDMQREIHEARARLPTEPSMAARRYKQASKRVVKWVQEPLGPDLAYANTKKRGRPPKYPPPTEFRPPGSTSYQQDSMNIPAPFTFTPAVPVLPPIPNAQYHHAPTSFDVIPTESFRQTSISAQHVMSRLPEPQRSVEWLKANYKFSLGVETPQADVYRKYVDWLKRLHGPRLQGSPAEPLPGTNFIMLISAIWPGTLLNGEGYTVLGLERRRSGLYASMPDSSAISPQIGSLPPPTHPSGSLAYPERLTRFTGNAIHLSNTQNHNRNL